MLNLPPSQPRHAPLLCCWKADCLQMWNSSDKSLAAHKTKWQINKKADEKKRRKMEELKRNPPKIKSQEQIETKDKKNRKFSNKLKNHLDDIKSKQTPKNAILHVKNVLDTKLDEYLGKSRSRGVWLTLGGIGFLFWLADKLKVPIVILAIIWLLYTTYNQSQGVHKPKKST